MALTLKQRINVRKSVDLASAVTFVEMAKEQIQKTAQSVLDGTLLVTDAAITGKGVTATQLTEWAIRALNGSMDNLMLAMILDSSRLPADPNAATDLNLNLAVKESVWPSAKLIGTGSL